MPIFTPELIARHAATATVQQDPAVSTPSHDRKWLHRVGLPALVGGQGADILTTLQALRDVPGAREGNPLLGQHPARIVATKAAVTAAIALLAEQLGKKSPKAGLLLDLIGGGIGAGAAVHNARLPR